MNHKYSIYNDSPDLYEDLLVKQRFRNPARDLISALQIKPGYSVLDVGTGTGVALLYIIEQLKGNGYAVGMDPSEEMLEIARSKGAVLLIKEGLPKVNFIENTFDRISASFVISHVNDYQQSLTNLYKILKPDGIFGATFWRQGQKKYNLIWDNIVQEFVNKDYLDDLSRQFLPWEVWFEDSNNIYAALSDAGFHNITITPREYSVDMTLEDYLECRYNLLAGKYLKRVLSLSQWNSFKSRVFESFKENVGLNITYVSRANVVLSEKK